MPRQYRCNRYRCNYVQLGDVVETIEVGVFSETLGEIHKGRAQRFGDLEQQPQ